ncbi:hypothetical protein AB0F81_47795 [Actinoplanes sp. NPDC024001]|uniref:hypothetical protein n=1 Tax=Actinoplanes sp. NPDC024001 TaxID=3154598 RepID=UPI0033C73563
MNLNLDEITRNDIAAALQGGSSAAQRPATEGAAHHGARDGRQAARERSGRARSGRAAGAAGGRSYAFRRS